MGSVAFDRVAGVLEVVLVVASLALLLAALTPRGTGRRRWLALVVITLLIGPFVIPAALLARWLEGWRGTPTTAIAVTAIAALSFAQPFGIRAEDLGSSPPAGLSSTAEQSPTASASSGALDFTFYRRDLFNPLAGLGECCPPTHTVRVRSWLLPGVLTHATELAEVCGDEPCWGPGDPYLKLRETDDGWYAVLDDPSKTVRVWRLSAGIASGWGLAYWIVSGAAIVGIGVRRRFAARPAGT